MAWLITPRTSLLKVGQAPPSDPDRGAGSSPQTTEASDSIKDVQSPRWRGPAQLVWIERVLLLCLIAGFAVKGFIPAWRHLNSDFPNYYIVAHLYHAGYPLDRVYEWTWLQRQGDHLGIENGRVGFIPLTFPSAIAVWPWCTLPPLEAKHWWLGANLVFLVLIAGLLTRITKLGWERVLLLMFLAFMPLRSNFLLGQMHLLVLLLLTFAAWLYFRKLSFLSGLTIAMAAALKIYPALFLAYFVCKKQWRATIGLLVGLAGAAAASIYAFGTDACVLYVRQILPAALRGEDLDPYHTDWNSWTALLRRLFIAEPELNPTPVAHLPWLYALLHPLIHGVIFVAFLWAISMKKRDGDAEKIEWAAYVFLLLFLSSHLGTYHLVALMLTGVLIADYLVARKQWKTMAVTVSLFALISGPLITLPWVSPTGWQTLLFFSRLLFMTLFGGVLLRMLVQQPAEFRTLFKVRNLAIPASALVVIVVVGFISTQRHFDGQFEDYKARVATAPGSLFAANPAVTSNSLLFTEMIGEGYTVGGLRTGSSLSSPLPDSPVLDLPRMGGDWFHPTAPDPTASEMSDSAWAERATRDGSRVVRFLTADLGHDAVSVTDEAENAEEPAVSPDGQVLAFLRAERGRNSLWIRTVGVDIDKPAEAAARQVLGTEYDVRDASFATGHRIIFSSNRTGQFALYVVGLSGDVQQLLRPTCSARYPAMSPDGRWVAFSCEQGGSWQLHAMDLQTNQDLRLSTGDCNSISPVWTPDSRRLIYATDCGRGLGLTALAEVTVLH